MSKKKRFTPALRFPDFVKEVDWNEESLISVVDKKEKWGFTGGPFGSNLKASDYTTEGIRIIQLQNIGDGEFYDDYKIFTSIEKAEELLSCNVYSGEIIISKMGDPVGRACIIPGFLKRCVMASDGIRLVVDEKMHSKYFIFSLINSKQIRDSIDKKATGSTRKRIGLDELKNIQLPIPPKLREQQKIASCLLSLDEVIAAHGKKLALLKEHKTGLMQNLFPQEGEKVPKNRFKEFTKDGEWKEKTIGDFIESHKGGAPLTPSDFVINSEFEVIPKKAIGEGMWLKIETPTYCSAEFCDRNQQSIVDSTYLITTLRDLVPSGPNIGYIVKYKGRKKYILAQGLYGLKLKNSLIPDFLIHFSNSKRYRKIVNEKMVGSTQVHLRNGEFFNIPITVPHDIKEQMKIAACITAVDELITAKMAQIQQLKVHKKGLTQGLFPKNN
jgi:type I restriction enzyme S subunit